VVATNEGQNVSMGIVTDSNDEAEEGEIVEEKTALDSDEEVEEGEIVEERTSAVKRRSLN
jgi:hypothetical protein